MLSVAVGLEHVHFKHARTLKKEQLNQSLGSQDRLQVIEIFSSR